MLYYLLHQLGASGQQIGLVLACQAVVGVLRLGVSSAIERLGGVKRATIGLFSAAYTVQMLVLVLVAIPLGLDDVRRLVLVIAIITVHQLLEALGTAALYDWLGRLVPPRVRGRYFAVRQRWQLVA